MGCKDEGMIKSEFVAKTQLLCFYLLNFCLVCGEFSLELAPETYSKENERVLQIEKVNTYIYIYRVGQKKCIFTETQDIQLQTRHKEIVKFLFLRIQ